MLKSLKGQNKIANVYIFCFTMLTIYSQCNRILQGADGANENLEKIDRPNFPDFDKFVEEFKKSYAKDSEEYKFRRTVYESRVKMLLQEFDRGQIGYAVGPNHMSDWTEQQRTKRKPLKVQEMAKNDDNVKIVKVSQTAGNPSSLDWREKGAVTSIKDQGQCGSCWTFATAAYGQSRLIIKGIQDKNVDLSEQYLLSCTNQCSCDGGYLEYVFDKSAQGIPRQKSSPYSPYGIVSPFICWSKNKIHFGYIPQKQYDLTNSQLESLLQNGPVAISVSATNWQDYKGGVFTCRPTDKVNHAVLLVGYTPTYWIIKNQWGQDWGEKGFIRVSRGYRYNCRIGASAFWMLQSNLRIYLAVLILLVLLL